MGTIEPPLATVPIRQVFLFILGRRKEIPGAAELFFPKSQQSKNRAPLTLFACHWCAFRVLPLF